MKKFALTTAALAVAFGAAATPALADNTDRAGLWDFDATIVAVDRSNGTIQLSTGQVLDQSIEYFAFPPRASAGDKLRVNIGNDNTLKGVHVIN